MVKFAGRLLAAMIGVIALFFGARAVLLFRALTAGPHNFTPGERACPPVTFFTGETEAILTILLSLAVVALAWMLWHRPAGAPR